MASHLSMLRHDGPPPIDPASLRAHLAGLAAARGSEPWFDAFTPVEIPGGAGQLHLDTIDAGPDARATVVFVPGTNAYALLYGEFLTTLADRGLNVVGLDPRGHGRSDGARGSYTLAELVEDVGAAVRWAERFGAPVYVAGSSQGGIAAFYYAATGAPLAGILCHNIADLDEPESARCMRHPRIGAAIRPHIGALARWLPELPIPMLGYLDLGSEPVRGAASAAEVLLTDPLTVPFVRLRALASLGHGPTATPAERITCPVFVLHAERDAIFPEDYVRSVFSRITSEKRMTTYAGLAHYMIVDDVAVFIDDVDAFITETCPPKGRAAETKEQATLG